MTFAHVLAAALGALTLEPSPLDSPQRVLWVDLVVNAPVAAVWEAWTTTAGIRTFLARDGRVEPRVDGLYAVYFYPAAPPGERGADDMRILSFEPERRLVFTWNAPPDNPYVRAQRTVVTLKFEPAPGGTTRLRFFHGGWGTGEAWDRAYAYFDRAWNEFVLPRLQWRFNHGPIDWSAPPTDLEPVAPTLQATVSIARLRPGT